MIRYSDIYFSGEDKNMGYTATARTADHKFEFTSGEGSGVVKVNGKEMFFPFVVEKRTRWGNDDIRTKKSEIAELMNRALKFG